MSEGALHRHKQGAVAEHSRTAAAFAERYSRLNVDPYESCFAYSRHRLQKLMERLLTGRGEGLRLLDVGCGTGHHLVQLRQVLGRSLTEADIGRLDKLNALAASKGSREFHKSAKAVAAFFKDATGKSLAEALDIKE